MTSRSADLGKAYLGLPGYMALYIIQSSISIGASPNRNLWTKKNYL